MHDLRHADQPSQAPAGTCCSACLYFHVKRSELEGQIPSARVRVNSIRGVNINDQKRPSKTKWEQNNDRKQLKQPAIVNDSEGPLSPK